MSVTYTRAAQLAQELKGVANDVRSLLARIDEFVSLNQTTSIDWGNAQLPASLVEDASGNLVGFTFSRADVSNAIFSLTQLQATLRNQAVTQGDHLGNITKIADAQVI